jgi:glycosyltransferase 2 family protein
MADRSRHPEPLLRIRLRYLLVVVAVVIAAHLLVADVSDLHEIARALERAQWGWLVLAALASAVTYVMAAVAIRGASGRPLPLGQATLVQLASSVANLLAPGGLGGIGVNTRYLERSGLTRAESVAAATLTNAAGVVLHVGAFAVLAGVLLGTGIEPVDLPGRWDLLVAIVAATTLAGIVFWSPIGRHRLLPPAREAARSLLASLRHPGQAALVFAGQAGLTVGYVLALSFSLYAFGAAPSLLDVAAAYLAGAAIGAISPTPSGLGAIEAALVGALIRLNVPSGVAVAGVLAFRLVTYWLPILPGAAAFHALRRRRVL